MLEPGVFQMRRTARCCTGDLFASAMCLSVLFPVATPLVGVPNIVTLATIATRTGHPQGVSLLIARAFAGFLPSNQKTLWVEYAPPRPSGTPARRPGRYIRRTGRT